ncbi:DUF4085 family protein [Brevibacillus reuszeri]|uniref:DUF4085 family protein n=1 Tax=Brevibacillus reuszeri TaxID=54915 RepID=UPI0013DFBC6F
MIIPYEQSILRQNYWLYNEIYATDRGFELHVLFDCPLTEWKIVAENVQIETVK